MGGSSADEFPLLSALGLYAADIRGDGKLLVSSCDTSSLPCTTHWCTAIKVHLKVYHWRPLLILFCLLSQGTASSMPSPIKSMVTSTNTLRSVLA